MSEASDDRVSSSLEVSDADSALSRVDGEFETDSVSALFGSLGRSGGWLVPDYLTARLRIKLYDDLSNRGQRPAAENATDPCVRSRHGGSWTRRPRCAPDRSAVPHRK